MPTLPSRSHPAPTLTAVVAAVLLATGWLGGAAHGAVPSRVLPGDAQGAEVELRPPALRSDDGIAEVEVALGAAAPGDVVVDLALADPEVAADGTVAPGPPATTGRTTAGGRLRPGEVLRVTVSQVSAPVLLVASVRPTGGDGSPPPATTLAALVLPGPVGPPPTLELAEVDGELRGTITATTPLLVTARLHGEQVVTHLDRLVLPGQPAVVTGAPARWPLPSELVVTDEAARTATASTGTTALIVGATTLVVAAAAGLGVLVWRRRAADRA